MIFDDEYYIREAMRLAKCAEDIDEVPVGAVAVRDGKIAIKALGSKLFVLFHHKHAVPDLTARNKAIGYQGKQEGGGVIGQGRAIKVGHGTL